MFRTNNLSLKAQYNVDNVSSSEKILGCDRSSIPLKLVLDGVRVLVLAINSHKLRHIRTEYGILKFCRYLHFIRIFFVYFFFLLFTLILTLHLKYQILCVRN